jgi:ATP-dependent exoDNAse (exonuclease V) alpha subunit
VELTIKQQEGLDIAVQRYRDKEKYVVISGYAGTGKSTLVKFIIEALDVDENKVAYATFTGKAAEVLRKKGNKNAMTLHRLLYDSRPRQGGGFIRIPKLKLDYNIIVVDECSMVPKSMIDMLLKHKVYVIFLGDPGQLPMIDKNESHDLLDHPHIFLDEIMRQAAESEIIQLTMKIRNGDDIPYMSGQEVQVIPKDKLVTGHLLWADTILSATNAVRHNVNNQMRELLGYKGVLNPGEKVICKRNYWEDLNDEGDALVNGTIGTVDNIFDSYINIPNYIRNDRHHIPTIMADFKPDGGNSFLGVSIDKDFLTSETPCVDWRVSYKIGQLRNRLGDILPRQITYGYALTCHAAQGSEWEKVLVLEENFPFERDEHKRWLYTAATRASEKLVLLR